MQSIVKYAMRGRTVKRFAASAAMFAALAAMSAMIAAPAYGAIRAVTPVAWDGNPECWKMKRLAEKLDVATNGGLEVDPDVVVLPGGDGLEVRTEAVKGAVGNYRRTIVSIRNKSGTPVQIDDIVFFRDWAPGGIRDGYRSGNTPDP